MYLAITVLATMTLYYELYVGGSVSTLILNNLHMSFTFFVETLAFGALIGALGSLFAGLTDRFGRANLVVFGLFFTGIFVAFILPAATNKWAFTIESFVVGFVEGVCLVATPALIRDFSPQVGRATAMGFWTSGPVLGSLIVSVVGTATVPAVIHDTRFWTHEYIICGIAGLVVFLIALVGLKELSPALRDQLMVTMRDRVLIEARAKGLTDADIAAALRNPFRQLIKADIIENLSRNDLTIDALSRRHRLQPRYIQRLFESDGTTFSEFLLGQRLARAQRMLADPRKLDQNIGAIAFECGFGDLSYFNRRFRRLYGSAPSHFRAT